MIERKDIQRVVDAADVHEVLADFLPELKKKGANYVCCCPFHGERTPSFVVSPARGRYHCFGCGEDGNAIDYLMRKQRMAFTEAVKHLAGKYHIDVKEVKRADLSPEEIEAYRKKEAMLAALETVQRFYVAQLHADNPEALRAKAYAWKRWGAKFCEEAGVGYAPASSRPLLDEIKRQGLSPELLKEAGVVAAGSNGDYAFLRERVTLPLRGDRGTVIAWTARYLGEREDVGKYMNPVNSAVFQKSEVLFGFDVARRQAAKSGFFILVEGAPDVMRLHAVGLMEAVAPLGTALTPRHLEKLGRICKVVRMIPDSDPVREGDLMGAGFKAAIKNGAMAMREGFEVSVREIPRTDEEVKKGTKQDPDSYITSRSAYNKLEDKPFLVWLAEKRLAGADSQDLKFEVVKEVSELGALVTDDTFLDMCVDRLSHLFGKPKIWRDNIRMARRRRQEKELEEGCKDYSPKEAKFMRKFGITIKDNMYFTPGKEEGMERLSNFIMVPDFHLKEGSGLRKFTLINEYGQRETLAIQQSKFSSVQSFQVETEKLGNFVWLAKQDKLNKVKEFLYAITESVNGIPVLGWNERGKFYAFADGVHTGEKFIPINAKGMVEVGGEKYFLPAYSDTYINDPGAYTFEKKLAYHADNGDSLHEFVQRLVDVFGQQSKVAFAWCIAAMFRDHVHKCKDWFPILNLFGIRGSGKTALAAALNSFFYPMKQDPPKLGNTTVPAITYMLEHAADSIVVLDEYTNLLKPKIVDVLKGLWGGTTNTRMNMGDMDKGISSGNVYSGVILCGQHQPNSDPALFSRCVHLTYYRTSFTEEENVAFTRLKEAAKAGNAHLGMEIMRHREHFTTYFSETYKLTRKEVKERFAGEQVNDRIFDNWIAVLAAFRTLETRISVPFSYADLFEICVKGIRHQNAESEKTSETGDFWQMINAMYMTGKVLSGTHFAIKYQDSFRPQKERETIRFSAPRKLLYLNWPALQEVLRQRQGGNQMKMDLPALDNYLRHATQFLGSRQKRFALLNAAGVPDLEFEGQRRLQKTSTAWALVFDYDSLKDACKIDLEATAVQSMELDEDAEIEEKPQEPEPAQEENDLFSPKV